jgi:uncharacterized membrane protein YccC
LLPVIGTLLWSQLNLPSLKQIIVTACVTLDRDVVSTQFRAAQRFIGCPVGGSLGLLVAVLAVNSLPVWSLIFFGGIVLFSRLHLGHGRWTYVGTQAGVAFILALVTGNNPPDSILPGKESLDPIRGSIGRLHAITLNEPGRAHAWEGNRSGVPRIESDSRA